MNHWCQQASRLASDRLDRRLRLSEQLRLWLHLALCRLCRGNARALQQLHTVVCDPSSASCMQLDEGQRHRIAAALSRKGG